MKNKYYKIAAIALGLTIQQSCYPSEKNFIRNIQKKLELTDPKEQYTCHATGLFFGGMFYSKVKKETATPFVYLTVTYIGCPLVTHSYKYATKSIKSLMLNHTELKDHRIKKK